MSKHEHPLEFLFRPRSIAVVGASTMPGPGSGFISAPKEMGFQGPIYPVNPKADEIQGLKCYPRLREVPGDVDYVISSVPARVVPELLEDCGEKHTKAIHFFTSGFSETGDADRADLEQQVLRRAKELGIRIVGPNCLGLCSPATGLSFFPNTPTDPGPVAMISQSGANAGEVCRIGALRGLRYSKVISYGNALDLDESDFLDYAARDPETKLVIAYIEGVKDGRRFLSALREGCAAKPVVVLKGGRTEAGGRATVSHTGSLAGAVQVFDAACRQAGAVRVDGLEDLVDSAVAFSFLEELQGPGVGVVGVGGGNSVLAADDIAACGLLVPPLPEETQHALGEFTPIAGTSVRNPVDTNVGFGPEGARLMRETLRLVSEAPNIDAIFFQAPIGWGPGAHAGGPAAIEYAREVATSAAEAISNFGKPIILILRPPATADGMEAVEACQEEAAGRKLATFSSVPRAARAMRKMLDWRAAR